ncbi:hypothetical protein EJ05DRAFT_478311 [Pseudovirgaria hyperparasitica]|uniref:Rhodopsin domain-containing protein n=1 Tax=Pseudovirgaria hyperparasitica TaxID=470096 RepID=A0A6A6VYE8_9PEZI|nr:uncharacterized protein EJ05DRAFT_478311 [Pseudovirgaria hyperparasitica]KAF2755293.1 hypothetical protein EJ05DRAFT_478311 [Pseudovirgaria hyperparasitica]
MYKQPYEAHMLTTVCFLLAAIGTLTTGLRFWSRRAHESKAGLEDWLILPALIFAYGVFGIALWGTFSHSLGYPAPPPNVPGPGGFRYSMSPEQKNFMMIQFVMHPLYALSTSLVKLSILFFYKRLFCTRSRPKFTYLVYTMVAIVLIWTVAYIFSQIFACGSSGVATRWDTVVNINRKCPLADNLSFAASIASFLTDLIILVMPIPKIWGLHMRTRQKFSIVGVFMIGSLATAASLVRLVNWVIVWNGHWSFPDGEYIATIAVTWMVVETGVGLIAASLLTLSPLIRYASAGRIIQSIRSTFSTTSLRSRGEASEGNRKYSRDESFVMDKSHTGNTIIVETDIETGWGIPHQNDASIGLKGMPAAHIPS